MFCHRCAKETVFIEENQELFCNVCGMNEIAAENWVKKNGKRKLKRTKRKQKKKSYLYVGDQSFTVNGREIPFSELHYVKSIKAHSSFRIQFIIKKMYLNLNLNFHLISGEKITINCPGDEKTVFIQGPDLRLNNYQNEQLRNFNIIENRSLLYRYNNFLKKMNENGYYDFGIAKLYLSGILKQGKREIDINRAQVYLGITVIRIIGNPEDHLSIWDKLLKRHIIEIGISYNRDVMQKFLTEYFKVQFVL